MASDIFMAKVDGDSIFYVDYTQNQTKEIGITQKAARALEDALSNVIAERDEQHEMLIAAGVIERKKTAEDIAKEALEEARAARQEAAHMADALKTNNEMLERMTTMLSLQQATPASATAPAPASTPAPTVPNTQHDKGGKK